MPAAESARASLHGVREFVLARGAAAPELAAAGIALLSWKWGAALLLAVGVAGTSAYVAFAPASRTTEAALASTTSDPAPAVAVVATASSPLIEPPAPAARTPVEQMPTANPAASQTTATIRGRLVRADGSPVSGASLRFSRSRNNLLDGTDTRSESTWKDPAPLATDADGRFLYSFEGVAGYDFRLRVDAPRCATAQWESMPGGPSASTELKDAILDPACTLRVRIVDANKHALTGFSVSARELKARSGPFRARTYFLSKLDEATSEHVFESAVAGRIALSVRHPLTRWNRDFTVEVAPDKPTQFEITYDGPSIADRIAVEASFQHNPWLDVPVEHVTLRREGMEPVQAQRAPSPNGVPNVLEPFVFAGLESAEYTLEIDDPRFERVVKTGLKPGGERVRIRLEGSAAIQFTLEDPKDNTPIRDYALALVFADDRTRPNRYDLRKAGAPEPADGLYAGLVPGTWRLAIAWPGAIERIVDLVDLRPGETRVVKVVNSERPALRGRVLAADAKAPLAGLCVTITAGDQVGMTRKGMFADTARSPGAIAPIDGQTKTDADGRFELTLTKPGRQAVRVEFGNWHVADVVVAEDKLSEPLTIVEPPSGWLEGTIRTTPGSAFEGYRMHVEPMSGPIWFPVIANDPQGFAIGKDGAFRIGPIDAVEIRVNLWAAHAGQIETQFGSWGVPSSHLATAKFVIEAGKTTPASFDLTQTMPARIRLTVSVDGTPLDRGSACGIPVDQKDAQDMATIEIARDGKTLLSGLRPTSTRLVVLPLDRSWAWTEPAPIALAPGAELAREVKIELVERTLELLDRGSAAPFANGTVKLVSGFGWARGEMKRTADAQGRVTVKLPAGDYALTVDGGTVPTPIRWSAEMPGVTTLRL